MPVTPYLFNDGTLNRVNAVGGLYVLMQETTTANYYEILYIGLSEDLRRRLCEHHNNPPIRGITHFHVEVIANAVQRSLRERLLISQFNPPGNVHYTR
jgi:excinuclease UvrABC nuclease subunit